MRLAATMLGLLALTGCEDTFDVYVRSDLLPGQEVTRVFVEVDGEDVAMTTVSFGDPLGRGMHVAALLGLTEGTHEIRVRLLGDIVGHSPSLVRWRRTRVNVAAHRSTTLVVPRECDARCGRETECLGGRCVTPECSPETPASCSAGECDSDAECASPIDCAVGRCVTGACMLEERPGACGAGEQCDWLTGCRTHGLVPLVASAPACGETHCCAVANPGTGSGDVLCWGRSAGGALRFTDAEAGAAGHAYSADLFDLVSGRDFSCLVDVGQQIYCWGDGSAGPLGRRSPGDQFGTVDYGRSLFRPIVAGVSHACASSSEGVVCWGRNDSGQANPNDPASIALPALLPIRSYEVALGERHSCAIEFDSSVVMCWGANESGQLGDGTIVDRREPNVAAGLAPARRLAVCDESTSCALVEDGSVWCWGANERGQLGRAGDASAVPIRVDGLPPVDSIVAGGASFCARAGAETWCWGRNSSGELGLGTRTDSERPTHAVALDGFATFDLGAAFGCGSGEGGRVACWGDNGGGQVTGRPGEPAIVLTPMEVVLE